MTKFKKILIIIAFVAFLPHISLAQNALGVPCDPAEPDTWETSTGCLDGVDINTGNAAPNPNGSSATPSTGTTSSDNGGLVPCSNTPDENGFIAPKDKCDFFSLMTLISTIINFLLFKMTVPIAAIMFAYAGFLMVTSGGSPEAKTKAKGIFTSVVFGLIIAIAAWLIIRTILSILGFDGSWIGF